MPLDQGRYIHTRRTNTHLLVNHDVELAPPNEFYVDKDEVPELFHFTDTWAAGHNYSSDEGQVVIGKVR